MPVKRHASDILCAFEEAQCELLGKAVVLTDGKAGTVEQVWLDEFHGLASRSGGMRANGQFQPSNSPRA